MGETYYITGFEKVNTPATVTNFAYTRDGFDAFNFTWNNVDGASSYNLYKAVENSSTYNLIDTVEGNSFTYMPPANELNSRTITLYSIN